MHSFLGSITVWRSAHAGCSAGVVRWRTPGKDLALPKLRQEWQDTPHPATDAVAEWGAAARAAIAEPRDWYAAAAVQYGWSRNVMLMMNRSMERTGVAPSNFNRQLAAQGSELAQQMAKDHYNVEFLGLSGEVAERELENALTSRITETLQELGPGFSFVGRQIHFDVDGDDYYVGLLFFHIEQLRHVVVGLKAGKFKPEHLGQLNF